MDKSRSGFFYPFRKILAIICLRSVIYRDNLVHPNHKAGIRLDDLAAGNFLHFHNVTPDLGDGALYVPEFDGTRALEVHQFLEVIFEAGI